MIGATDWPTYGHDAQHSFNGVTTLNSTSAPTLTRAWFFPTGDAVTANPTVVADSVYVGSWDGYFYAIDARSGQLRWKFRLDCQLTVVPIPEVCRGPSPGPDASRFTTPGGIVTASPVVSKGKVYFAGGKTVYALKASDGTLLWKH